MKSEFISEKIGGHSPAHTRKEYSEILLRNFDINDKNKAKVQEEYKIKGTKKYIREGAADRLSAKPYSYELLTNKNYNTKEQLTGDERSYYYGYYNLATEKIAIQIKHPEIKRIASIEEIGYNDAISGISLESLPKEINTSKEYLIGYKKGLEKKSKQNKTK